MAKGKKKVSSGKETKAGRNRGPWKPIYNKEGKIINHRGGKGSNQTVPKYCISRIV